MLNRTIKKRNSAILEQWILDVGLRYMQRNKLSEKQEQWLGQFTNFCLEDLGYNKNELIHDF